jgi:hypothetical protein
MVQALAVRNWYGIGLTRDQLDLFIWTDFSSRVTARQKPSARLQESLHQFVGLKSHA